MDRDTDRDTDRDMDRDRDQDYHCQEVTVLVGLQDIKSMKQLFALITVNLRDEATLSLINVKVEEVVLMPTQEKMVNLPSFSGEDSKVGEARSLSNQLMECHSTHWGGMSRNPVRGRGGVPRGRPIGRGGHWHSRPGTYHPYRRW
jgi:hypothetical protein